MKPRRSSFVDVALLLVLGFLADKVQAVAFEKQSPLHVIVLLTLQTGP